MISFFTKSRNHAELGEILKKEGLLTKEQFETIVRQAEKAGRHLTEIIFEDSSLPEEKTLALLCQFYDLPPVFLRKKVISPLVINLIPKEVAEQHNVIIFKKIKDVIHVAITNPENYQILEFIKKKTELEPIPHLTTPKDINVALRKYNTQIGEDLAQIIDYSVKEAAALNVSPEQAARFLPVIKMVNGIIEKALGKGASDIHVEPTLDKIIIRYRIDGMLNRVAELPKEALPLFITRIKILANLKIDEHMIPQDGRFHFKYQDQEIAIRVSIIPTLHGPKAALRLLEMQQKVFTLRKLGLNQNHYGLLKNEIKANQGMILVTGPTGSGKTTTLYTLMRMLNREDVNICTIEDPIEYSIDNINQMQVKPQVGLTFASGLRSLLRQDPNIIMVGEIRDEETASMAANSAMTGHLVLSTLHTNNAFFVVQRLYEMGIQPYLLASVINLVIGQRLVRRICSNCRGRGRFPEKIIANYQPFLKIKETITKLKKQDLLPKDIKVQEFRLLHGRGCAKCNYTGYQGRVGIYEILKIDRKMRKLILSDNSEEAIRRYAASQNILTMAEDGILKVLNGVTTFDEVLRVTKE
ncbi:MAG: GspE/PulE family protein [bacterium]